MTPEEQERIVRSLQSFDEQSIVALSKRVETWAKEQFGDFCKSAIPPHRGICVQYRVAGIDKWYELKRISITAFSWETSDDYRSRKESVQGLFTWGNYESSNQMGDVIAVRYMPYIDVNNENKYKMDEVVEFACTDTGKRRQWNQLNFNIYTEPSQGVRGYNLIRPDIHKGKDICWYQPWHFSLADDVDCPVGPIMVEEVDKYNLVLRYGDKLFPLSMDLDKPHTADLIVDQPVKPTHNWDSIWLRPPYTFTLVATVSWKEKLYSSSNRKQFLTKPHFVLTSDLPEGVKTSQQLDHEAWEEGVRTGRIPHNE